MTVHADKQRADDPDVKDAFQTRADYCLMATGRKPNTHNLGLEEVEFVLRTQPCLKHIDIPTQNVLWRQACI